VHFRGDNGYLSIFNIYNEITNHDTIHCLDLFLNSNAQLIRPTSTDSILWLGDFNRHHPIWEDEANECLYEVEEFISPLIDLLYKNDMLLALPKGIPTLQSTTGNWTQPDGVWRSNAPDDPIIRCDVVPSIRPPLADHLPIITILNLSFPCSSAPKSLNFWLGDWMAINLVLKQRLEEQSPAVHIKSGEEFIVKVDEVVGIITEVLEDHLEEMKPSPFTRHWWTKELSTLKKNQNRLSNKSFKLRHLHAAEHRAQYAVERFARERFDRRIAHADAPSNRVQ